MTRNLKALGLALLATFAMSAIAAQAASATNHTFTSDEEETVLTGSQVGVHHFSVNGVTVECKDADFRGTVVGEAADHVAVHPEYGGPCFLGEGGDSVEVGVDTDACTYTFDSDTTENPHPLAGKEEGEEDAPVDIVCPEENEIVISGGGCTIHVPSQAGLHGVTYDEVEDEGKDAIEVSATVNTITAVSTGGLACAVLGLGFGTTHHTDGIYTGDTLVTGFKDGGETSTHNYTEGDQNNIGITTP